MLLQYQVKIVIFIVKQEVKPMYTYLKMLIQNSTKIFDNIYKILLQKIKNKIIKPQ